jgi:hypothetical protein
VSHLTELPLELFEMAGKLGYADTAPVLTIRPNKLPVPNPPVMPTPAIPKSQRALKKYWTQCTYPRVVCYPLSDLPAVTALTIKKSEKCRPRANESDLEVIAKSEQIYKLSTFNGVRLKKPLWCTVKYGPWAAIAIEKESCSIGEQNHWTFYIVEMPEVLLEWYGYWEDIPSYPSLHVFTGDLNLYNEEYNCCPGFKWCRNTNSCISKKVDCQDPVPA